MSVIQAHISILKFPIIKCCPSVLDSVIWKSSVGDVNLCMCFVFLSSAEWKERMSECDQLGQRI